MPTVGEQFEELLAKYIEASERSCWHCHGHGSVVDGAPEETRAEGFLTLRYRLVRCSDCDGAGKLREHWKHLGGAIASDAIRMAVWARDASDFDTMNAALDEAHAFLDRCLAKLLESEEGRERLQDAMTKLAGAEPPCDCGAPGPGALTAAELAELGLGDDTDDAVG